jgi:outer membrane protein assembly factor BamA
VRAEGDPAEPVVIIIEVEEELRVRRVEVNGLEHANANMIQDTVGLEAGRPLNRQRILDAKALMRSELAEEGIPFANIEDRLEPVDGSPSEVDVIIDVEEGQRITVAQVEFIDNQGVSDDDLRGAMDVEREGFWWFSTGSFTSPPYTAPGDTSTRRSPPTRCSSTPPTGRRGWRSRSRRACNTA